MLALCAVLAALVLVGCDSAKPYKPPKTPMPSNVPSRPSFSEAEDVVVALGKEGIECDVLRRRNRGLDCVAEVDGGKTEIEISVFSDRTSRADIGASIASRRRPPYQQTLVAAGNWYIWVRGAQRHPDSAPAIAKALDAVVLQGKGPKTPKYPLPDIPSKPRYQKVDDLADALDKSVGCTERETTAVGSLKCLTGKPGLTNCAVLALHKTDAQRDAVLREAIKYRGVPAMLVTAGNWTVNLCDRTIGSLVARDLGGVVVAYDGR